MDYSYENNGGYPPSTSSSSLASRPRRQRRSTIKATALSDEEDEYIPSSSVMASTSHHHHHHHSAAPKLKLKMTSGHGAEGGGTAAAVRPGAVQHDATGIGWDRELDSDPEVPLAVEEQFLLRVPKHIAPQMKELVESRNLNPKDLSFKFKDSRRAVFHFKGKDYSSKLVDLPTLLESQRLTGSGGNAVKVADVCQMLVVDEDEIKDEAEVTKEPFNIEDFNYPHGITPPLKHVRKRRFRKRINKRTIEIVESAVEKLLEKDSRAEQVQYELLDHDIASEDEYDNNDDGRAGADSSVEAPTPRRDGSVETPALGEDDDDGAMDDGEAEGDDDDDVGGAGSGYDSDLANEINKGMEAVDASSSDDDDSDSDDAGGLFGAGSSDDDDDEEQAIDPETIEQKKRIKLLGEEIKDLENKITDSELNLAKAANPIFKKRFEDTIKKLTADRDGKRAQHAKAVAEMEKRRSDEASAALAAADAAANPEPVELSVVDATSGEPLSIVDAKEAAEHTVPTATLAGGQDRMEVD